MKDLRPEKLRGVRVIRESFSDKMVTFDQTVAYE